MTALQLLLKLHEVCQFRSQERGPGPASKGELRRLVDQRAFQVNGVALKANEEVVEPVVSLVLFPKSPLRRTTLL